VLHADADADADFDHVAAVTGQFTQWVVPRGSTD